LEKQEKVLRVILQKTKSRRQGRECYEAIPPRSSCRQDQGLLQVDHDKLQIEVSRLRLEKEALENLVASGDATIEELEKDKNTLIHDMAGTFEEGFKEALAQAVCENPGIDVSNCDSTHHIVDGKVVPLELDD